MSPLIRRAATEVPKTKCEVRERPLTAGARSRKAADLRTGGGVSPLAANRHDAPEPGRSPYALQAPFLTADAVAAISRARRLHHPVWLLGGPGAGAYEITRALHEEGDPRGFVSVRQTVPGPTELEERLRAATTDDPGIDRVTLYIERIERQGAAVQERLLRWSTEGAFRGGRPIPVRSVRAVRRRAREVPSYFPRSAIGFPP